MMYGVVVLPSFMVCFCCTTCCCFNVGEITQERRCNFQLSFSPLFMSNDYVLFSDVQVRWRGDSQERSNNILLSFSPLLVDLICLLLFLVMFNSDVGEIHRVVNLVLSFSPLWNRNLSFMCIFRGVILGVIFVHFKWGSNLYHFPITPDDTVVRAGITTPLYVYI